MPSESLSLCVTLSLPLTCPLPFISSVLSAWALLNLLVRGDGDRDSCDAGDLVLPCPLSLGLSSLLLDRSLLNLLLLGDGDLEFALTGDAGVCFEDLVWLEGFSLDGE